MATAAWGFAALVGFVVFFGSLVVSALGFRFIDADPPMFDLARVVVCFPPFALYVVAGAFAAGAAADEVDWLLLAVGYVVLIGAMSIVAVLAARALLTDAPTITTAASSPAAPPRRTPVRP